MEPQWRHDKGHYTPAKTKVCLERPLSPVTMSRPVLTERAVYIQSEVQSPFAGHQNTRLVDRTSTTAPLDVVSADRYQGRSSRSSQNLSKLPFSISTPRYPATMPRKLMSMPHVAMMDTEQRMALYAFFQHVSRRDHPDGTGSFTYEEQQVYDRLYNKAYNYGSPLSRDPAGEPSREARDRFCHRFLPNLCGYEPTKESPNPLPPPALSRRDIEERLRDCERFDNCWLEGCVRRHDPDLGRNHAVHGRPASLDTSESAFPEPPRHRLRNLIKTIIRRRDD